MKLLKLAFWASFFLFYTCDAPNQENETALTTTTDSIPLVETPEEIIRKPVLGWHRVAEGYKEYNYDVLNMFAYFSYKVNPKTGENQNEDTWTTDLIIDTAMAKGCKVYLTVTNFGFGKNSELLNNTETCDTLIKRLSNLVEERDADGVCVDFEEIHKRDTLVYNRFLADLSTQLRKTDKELIVVLPIYFEENTVDPIALDTFVDYYIMMGYACYHMGSGHAGPISPWSSGDIWEPYSLEPNVQGFLDHSFKAESFMVALPLYGGIWNVESDNVNAKSLGGVKEPTYNQIMEKFAGQIPQLDSTSQSSYYSYTEDGNTRQCWFESEDNLQLKIQRLMDKNIAGIGFWAMGYADQYPDLWDSIGVTLNGSQ